MTLFFFLFQLNSRILVVTGSSDSASQYMNYMNVFFTAQKQNVVIDVCALDQHLSLLQQGCDITSGLYLKVPQLQGLLQYLLVFIKICFINIFLHHCHVKHFNNGQNFDFKSVKSFFDSMIFNAVFLNTESLLLKTSCIEKCKILSSF